MPVTPRQVEVKGRKYHRQEKIFIPEWNQEVVCAPYDDHWIYATKMPWQSAYMCTCGSAAVVVGAGAKAMLICLHHATFGKHTTGGDRCV